MKCQSIRKNNKKICIADFDKKIKIQSYSLKLYNVADAEINFVDIAEVWAFIKTRNNANVIASVNTDETITIDCYTRYMTVDCDTQIFIEYEGKRFKINSIENIDKDDKIIIFRATERGNKDLNANRI